MANVNPTAPPQANRPTAGVPAPGSVLPTNANPAPPAANPPQTGNPAPPAANEGEAPKKKRGGFKKKPKHPALTNEQGESVKLKGLPEDYDRKEHAALKKSDFEDESVYWDCRAYFASQDATEFQETAESCRRAEKLKGNKAAMKLMKMEREIEKLRAQLKEQGDDPDALLSEASA